MRDLRSPVFLHVDGGGILINLMFGLASVRRDGQNDENRDLPVKQCRRLRAKCGKLEFARKTRRAVMVCCSKNIGSTCTVFYI